MVNGGGGVSAKTLHAQVRKSLRGEVVRKKDSTIPWGLEPLYLLRFLVLVRESVENLLLNVADMVGLDSTPLTPRILVVSISGVICHNCMRYSEDMSMLVKKDIATRAERCEHLRQTRTSEAIGEVKTYGLA